MSKNKNIGVRGNNMLFLNLLEILKDLSRRTNVEGIDVFNIKNLNYSGSGLTKTQLEKVRYSYQLNTQEEVYKLKLMLYYLDPVRYDNEAAHFFPWCEISLTDLPYNIRLSHYKMKQP